jgi:hypothetical protein
MERSVIFTTNPQVLRVEPERPGASCEGSDRGLSILVVVG